MDFDRGYYDTHDTGRWLFVSLFVGARFGLDGGAAYKRSLAVPLEMAF